MASLKKAWCTWPRSSSARRISTASAGVIQRERCGMCSATKLAKGSPTHRQRWCGGEGQVGGLGGSAIVRWAGWEEARPPTSNAGESWGKRVLSDADADV